MTFKDYKFVLDFEVYQVAEEDQPSQVRFVPLIVSPEDKEVHITVQAFKCREFMQDWQWFCLTGVTGEVYELHYDDGMRGHNCGMYGLTHMGMVSSSARERRLLAKIAVESVRLPKPVQDMEENEYEELFILEIPEYVRDRPLGLALWTAGVRGQVEANTTEDVHPVFGWPEDTDGALSKFVYHIEEHVPIGDFLEFCTDKSNLFRIDPTNPEHCHDHLTYSHHEGFSPVSMITQAVWHRDREYNPNLYGSQIDALSRYQVELIKPLLKSRM